jgi:hypothetical protein
VLVATALFAIFFSISGGLTAVGPIAGGYLTDWRGAILVCAGMGLAVLGMQQASVRGWSSVATWVCLVAGLVLLAGFARLQLRIRDPLVPLRLFADRAFATDNAVLFLISVYFVPLFFFASLGAQWGGRILDRRGARPTVVLGCALGAVGFYLWADALNRSGSTSYGAVTGVTQTVRNFAGSTSGSGSGGSLGTHASAGAYHAVQLDFASATKEVILAMAIVMAVAFLVSVRGMPRRIETAVGGAGQPAVGSAGSAGSETVA